VICSSIEYTPKYLQISLYVSLDKAPKILNRTLLSSLMCHRFMTDMTADIAREHFLVLLPPVPGNVVLVPEYIIISVSSSLIKIILN